MENMEERAATGKAGRLRPVPRSGPLVDGQGRIVLLGLSLTELAQWIGHLGEQRYRARQLYEWIYNKGERDFAAMTNLSKQLRARLQECAVVGSLQVAARQDSAVTGTAKFLFRLADGETIEGVLMPQPHGLSACISTQVGCRMGCRFCASTLAGLSRNLSAGEIVEQVLLMRDHPSGSGRLASVVIMGVGEPLENLDALVPALRLMHDPDGIGIGYRHITVSTCGLVPQMYALAEAGVPVRLALSLHAVDDDLRRTIMPVARIYPLDAVIAAAAHYARVTGRRVTYEYVLIAGVNDSVAAARRLAELARPQGAHINLIPFNPVDERPYRRPSPRRVAEFAQVLTDRGAAVTVRREMGADIAAACGQLRRQH